MIKVNELFNSLQGEGPDIGVSTVFLRLTGCNVACVWCDTKYAWQEGEELSIAEVVNRISEVDTFPSKRVYITGGEPLVQGVELGNLVKKLAYYGYTVTVATNGTLVPPDWWEYCIWDIDMKCPTSGVSVFNRSWATSGTHNRIKFVVADRHDLDFVLRMLPSLTGSRCPALIVSPMIPQSSSDNYINPVDRMALVKNNWLQEVWSFCIQYNLRYSLQIHKVIFGVKKGV